MTKEERIKDITSIGNLLAEVLIILNDLHDTRELSILRTDLQKLIAFYMFYIFAQETGLDFNVEAVKEG